MTAAEEQPIPFSNAGWAGTIRTFLASSEQSWLGSLQRHHERCMLMPAEDAQITAWRNCFRALQSSFANLAVNNPSSATWHLVVEYELPRERGRRPDVVVLTRAGVIVLEFKDSNQVLQAHIDQASAYARDLSHYHAACHGRDVRPVLVLTQMTMTPYPVDDVIVSGPRELAVITDPAANSPLSSIDVVEWVNADYSPLPSLISAARTIFQHEPLPQIRRAHSAGIADTIATLTNISDEAERTQGLHLALVTGVPGAGKTLVGLQFVYTHHADNEDDNRPAVFLSGNGPLVKVLQHALKSSVFVQDVHGFLRDYGGTQHRLPNEHIWVYDEAQRAWDAERVQGKRGHGASEPEDFLRLGRRLGSWAVVVGLIGEGQEIHLGEEAGLGQWNDAIASVGGRWTVHCPPHVSELFTAADRVDVNQNLNLNVSLRSHLAEDVQVWIKYVLGGKLSEAAGVAARMRGQGFDAYITRNLAAASDYVRERYAGQEDKRYGLLASSKARNVARWGVENSFSFTRRLREGPWYNDPPSSRFSCCQLHDVATEFACQGLELDFPVVAWGDDLRWNGARWQSPTQTRSKARDPHQLRVNSYRVLLSRGRDGFVVFVPDDVAENSTAEALQTAGLVPLSNVFV